MEVKFDYRKIFGIIGFLFFININYINATITWNGGSGNWDVAANWDSGSIPVSTDEVSIPSGAVYLPGGITGEATNVIIASGAKLQLRKNSTLLVAGALDKHGIENNGKLLIYGNLNITDIRESIAGITVNGINNVDIFFVGTKGKVTIAGISDSGIFLSDTAKFTNHGKVDVADCDNISIFTRGKNFNYGEIYLQHITDDTKDALVVFGNFKNYEEGLISIDGGNDGIANALATSGFKNWGTIYSENAGHSALHNNGTFINYSTGLITCENSGFFNLHNDNNGYFTNEGECYFKSAVNYGIGNKNVIENLSYINIHDCGSAGIFDFTPSAFDNHGVLNFTGFQTFDFYISNTFTNHDDGFVTTRNAVYLTASGTINNAGFWWNFEDSPHGFVAGGQFINDGVVTDTKGGLSAIITNQQVIVEPVAAQLNDGIAFAPILNIAATDKVVIGSDWYTDNTASTIAGTFDVASNTLIPNANAINLTALIFSIEIPSSNHSIFSILELDNPIAALVGRNPKGAMQFRQNPNSDFEQIETLNFSTFPNPSNGSFTLTTANAKSIACRIEVFNLQGKKIYTHKYGQQQTMEIDLPAAVGSGNYFLKIYAKDDLLSTKRISIVN